MKLTRRQLHEVSKLIEEDAQGIYAASVARRRAIKRLDEGLLSEVGPDAMRVDWDIMKKAIDEEVYDLALQMVQECLPEFASKACDIIASVMNRHGMSGAGYVPKKGLYAEMSEEAESTYEYGVEAQTDVANALTQYAQKLGELAVHLYEVRPGEEDY